MFAPNFILSNRSVLMVILELRSPQPIMIELVLFGEGGLAPFGGICFRGLVFGRARMRAVLF